MCFLSSKHTGHTVIHANLFNSYAIPESKCLGKFLGRMGGRNTHSVELFFLENRDAKDSVQRTM